MTDDRKSIRNLLGRRPVETALAVVLLLMIAVLILAPWNEESPSESEEIVQRAELAVESGDLSAAERLAETALESTPDSPRALLAAAVAAAGQQQTEKAIEFLNAVGPEDKRRRIQALGLSADLYLHQLGQFEKAEHALKKLLQLQPDEPRATKQLIRLLFMCGRQFEGTRQLRLLVRSADWQKEPQLQALQWLAEPDSGLGDAEFLDFARKAAWGDPSPGIGLARLALQREDRIAAESLIRRSVKQNPELLDAQALAGNFLATYAGPEKFEKWLELLPVNAPSCPDIWDARALRAERTGDRAGAVRCSLEAVKRNPDHIAALQRLLDHSDMLAHRETEERIRRRMRVLKEFHAAVRIAAMTTQAVRPLLNVARAAEKLDRRDEAVCWHTMARLRDPAVPEAPEQEFLEYPDEVADFVISGVRIEDFPLPDASLPLSAPGIFNSGADPPAAESSSQDQ